MTLIYVHIGQTVPEHLYDSIYQSLLINQYKTKIYVIVDDTCIDTFQAKLQGFSLDLYLKEGNVLQNVVQTIPISVLDDYLQKQTLFQHYNNVMSSKFKTVCSFRDGFWLTTTSRFFYIYALMTLFKIKYTFHIENDIMMYEPFADIQKQNTDFTNIWMVQDAPNRVVPSILFFPTQRSIKQLLEYITSCLLNTNTFVNDMELLGAFDNKMILPTSPDSDNLIFDGAAIGQFLGGVDPRNITDKSPIPFNILYNNTSIGFVNETSTFKANTCYFFKKMFATDEHKVPIGLLLGKQHINTSIFRVANVHVHSKQLYNFSSVFDIKYHDIISGDRITGLCDFVITTRDIYDFHQNLTKFAKDVILVNDWKNINIYKLNEYFRQYTNSKSTTHIRLFIYTHTLKHFLNFVVNKLDRNLQYSVYLHNSDHPFDMECTQLLNKTHIKHVFAQNINCQENDKLSLLPIGIANSMWRHGNLDTLYTVMIEIYKLKKTEDVYVNINPSTFGYRQEILNKIKELNCFELSGAKPYKEYLLELSKHRFCICIRGNGIDTHRFWECLYLGVVPIIINNKYTRCTQFINYLRKLDVPFVEITEDDTEKLLNKYNKLYFSQERYETFVKKYGSFWNLKALKLSHYCS